MPDGAMMMMPAPEPERRPKKGDPVPPAPPKYKTGGEWEWKSNSLGEFMRNRTSDFDGVPWDSSDFVKYVAQSSVGLSDFTNVFWSIVISAGGLWSFGRSPSWPAINRSNYYVVPYESNGSMRFNLLVFVPEDLSRTEMRSLEINDNLYPYPFHLIIEKMLIQTKNDQISGREPSQRSISLIEMLTKWQKLKERDQMRELKQIVKTVKPAVVFVKAPLIIEQATLPSNALGLTLAGEHGPTSSAGVIAKDQYGNEGVTVAYHGLKSGNTRGHCGQQVDVGGCSGEVASIDPLTDSAFVKLSGGTAALGKSNFRAVRSGSTPGYHEVATFDGLASGPNRTYTDATAPLTMVNMPGYQRTVLTRPDTQNGDSGCALVDKDQEVMGFCLGTTGLSEVPPVSIWIWAESVFNEHRLT
jgi:hypothetical protein